jgi:hypothetical protein
VKGEKKKEMFGTKTKVRSRNQLMMALGCVLVLD